MKPIRGAPKALIVALAAAILIGLAAIFVLPPIVKSQAESRLSQALGRTVTLGRVQVNPFTLSLTLRDLDVRERDPSASFLGWSRLYVRFDAIRSLAGDWVIGDVELDGFHAAVTVNPDGSFNFSDILAKAVAAAPKGAAGPSGGAVGRAVRVSSLSVGSARVAFLDRSLRHPFSTTLGPLSFTLTGFRTSGSHGAPYHFEASTEAGERLSWSGTLAADPVASAGRFSLEDLALAKYMPYLESRTGADVKEGRLSVRGRYDVSLDPAARRLALDGAEVHLSGLRVAERPSGLGVFELGSLDITGIDADAVAMKATVARVSLADGHASVRRARDGTLNLLAMVPAEAPEPGAAPGPRQAPPQFLVKEVGLSGFSADIEDQVPAHAARLAVGPVALSASDVTLAAGSRIPFHLSLNWAPKGTVTIDGTFTPGPAPRADLTARVSEFSLVPLSPYLEQFVNAHLAQGSVSTSVTVEASLPRDGPTVSVKGDFSLADLGIVDGIRDKELAGVGRLALTGIDAVAGPGVSASVDQVEVRGPYARARVDEDGSLNVASLLVKGPAATRGPARAPNAGPAPVLRIGRIVIGDGSFTFTDHSVEPNVRASLDSFGGTVSGLSSENLARADVDLKGMVGGAGPLEIAGKLDPLGARPFVDLSISVRNADLVPLSPYSGRFAGYELARGQLAVDSRIHVDGDRLDSANVVTLNQFTFGGATGSRDATSLPVRLGVALLKDVDGRIVIDLPVQGTIGDPNFRVGRVVLRVVENLLTKAAVSPFSLVGSMFGGGGEELAYQQFAPGSSELSGTEAPKLQTIARALANRPGLNLGIAGGYDAAADTYALRRLKLADLVRRSAWEERHLADPATPAPDKLVVAPSEYAAALKRLFDAKFPPGTTFGTPLPPPPAAAPPPLPPRPGILERIVDAVTFRRQREERAARRESDRLASEHDAAVKAAVASGLPQDEMAGRLAESIAVSTDDLRALAAARAGAVRERLMGAYSVAAGRLFLDQGQGAAAGGARATLSLQ